MNYCNKIYNIPVYLHGIVFMVATLCVVHRQTFATPVASTQNKCPELVLDPDVDEEVGEVVDKRHVVEMRRRYKSREKCDADRRERGHAHQEQTCSDLHRLLVTI